MSLHTVLFQVPFPGNTGALENIRKLTLNRYKSVRPQAQRTPIRGTLLISHQTHGSKANLNPRYCREAALARRWRLRLCQGENGNAQHPGKWEQDRRTVDCKPTHEVVAFQGLFQAAILQPFCCGSGLRLMWSSSIKEQLGKSIKNLGM